MTTQTKDDASAWPSSNPGYRPNAEGEAGVETGRRVRIAFVEDDDDFREAASGELGDYGFDVAAFRDGTGLVEFLETAGDIEIIVLDWGLPRVSGIDLLPRLQRAGINLPVVFLTGHSEPNYEQLALDRGAVLIQRLVQADLDRLLRSGQAIEVEMGDRRIPATQPISSSILAWIGSSAQ